jgi:hypothetical protein
MAIELSKKAHEEAVVSLQNYVAENMEEPKKDSVEEVYNTPFIGMPLAHVTGTGCPRYFGLLSLAHHG